MKLLNASIESHIDSPDQSWSLDTTKRKVAPVPLGTGLEVSAADLSSTTIYLTFAITLKAGRICVHQVVPRPSEQSPQSTGEASGQQQVFNEMETNLLEALGDETMHAEALAKKAGYPNNSNFRTACANLVRRQLFGKSRQGYYRAKSSQ